MKRLWGRLKQRNTLMRLTFPEIKGTKIPDESSPFRQEFLEQLKGSTTEFGYLKSSI